MLSSQEQPKDLPEWSELDYFLRPRPLRSWRTWVVRGSLLVCVLLALGLAFVPRRGWSRARVIYEADPVSLAHAAWRADCDRCHTESFRTLGRLWHANESMRSVPDDACQVCHDGPIHHANQVSNPNCASCHREHRGRERLAEVPDADCTVCHANLQTTNGETKFDRHVADFNQHHPAFGHWREGGLTDPGTIRFNHKLHLQKNLATLDANRKRGTTELECQKCHQPDESQRYMRPITYQEHCASCHPLGVSIMATSSDPDVQKAIEEFSKISARHPLPGSASAGGDPFRPARDVVANLRQRYLDFLKANPKVLQAPTWPAAARPLPGHASVTLPASADARTWVEDQLQAARGMLLGQAGSCRYCHQEVAREGNRPDGLPAFAPPAMLGGEGNRWLPHSRFSHAAHRLLQCDACHAGALTSTHTPDVLIPAIDNCQRCHKPDSGARADCVECHRYHNRLQGRGLNGRLTIDQCTGQASGTSAAGSAPKAPDHGRPDAKE